MLSRKWYIDMVTNKISSACFALRNIKYIVSMKTLRLIIYFAYVQSVMSYGIIFWGGSSYAKKVFILQKNECT
jgi:hydrogenase-4 membrane subunit HyfE